MQQYLNNTKIKMAAYDPRSYILEIQFANIPERRDFLY